MRQHQIHESQPANRPLRRRRHQRDLGVQAGVLPVAEMTTVRLAKVEVTEKVAAIVMAALRMAGALRMEGVTVMGGAL